MEPIPDPPGEPVEFELATPGARLGARFVDLLIGFATFLTTLVIVVVSYDIELTDDPDTLEIPDSGAFIVRWIPILVWGMYEVWLVARRGQTLGKMVTRIKVITTEGAALVPMKAAAVRWLVLAVPPVLIPDLLFGLGVSFLVGMWFVIDGNRQGLHDKAAGTYVVRAVSSVD